MARGQQSYEPPIVRIIALPTTIIACAVWRQSYISDGSRCDSAVIISGLMRACSRSDAVCAPCDPCARPAGRFSGAISIGLCLSPLVIHILRYRLCDVHTSRSTTGSLCPSFSGLSLRASGFKSMVGFSGELVLSSRISTGLTHRRVFTKIYSR